MSSSTETLNLGYLVPEFPTQTHNFFWKEIGALRAEGVLVHLFSTKAPDVSSSPHPFRDQAVRETTCLFPLSVAHILNFALFHPVQITKAVGYIHSLREALPAEKLRLIALIPSAIELLTNDLDLRFLIGEADRARVEQEFDHHAMAARLIHHIVL